MDNRNSTCFNYYVMFLLSLSLRCSLVLNLYLFSEARNRGVRCRCCIAQHVPDNRLRSEAQGTVLRLDLKLRFNYKYIKKIICLNTVKAYNMLEINT